MLCVHKIHLLHLGEFLAADVEGIEGVGAVGAVFEEVFFCFGLLLTVLAFMEAVTKLRFSVSQLVG